MAPTAKDRTAQEHLAQVVSVRWQSEDNEFCILSLSGGVTAHGQTDPKHFVPGVIYRFMGRWKHNPKYGDQFHFDTYVADSPAGKVGVVEYLSTICHGIGRRLAERLWEQYGGLAVHVLREDPSRVADDNILEFQEAHNASIQLTDNKAKEATRIALFDILKGRGFHGKLQDNAILKWGAKAPQVIRKDPFQLMGMGGAGFKRCDKLWLDLGLSPKRLRRQMYASMEAIRNDRAGHTWLTVDRARECCMEAVGPDARPGMALKMGLRTKRLSHHVDDDGRGWITLVDRNESERSIADSIRRLTKLTGVSWPHVMIGGAGEVSPSEHQLEQLRLATASRVGIFVGGPGSGKTFTLAFLLRDVIERYGKEAVAVCAPTGKAAVRATESLSSLGLTIRATTIHSLLEIGKTDLLGGKFTFQRCLGNPLPQKFIVVDESSMIDADLMASLLSACASGTHVLFIGDPYQLPPVGVGAPLRDMIAAGVATGELTEIRRNAGRIVHACQAIKTGQQIEWSPKMDLEAGENLKIVNVASSSIMDVVRDILNNLDRFDCVWETQVIVGLNEKGACSRTILNEQLQNLLNPTGRTATRCKFRVGDKIICLKNAQLKLCCPARVNLKDWELEDAKNYKDVVPLASFDAITGYTANGEIGRVVAVSDGQCVATFNNGQSLVKFGARSSFVNEGTGEKTGGDTDFDLAYAVTCHKLQGSEAPFVIIVADEAASQVATREWWYTAISRAKSMCVVVGPCSVVDRQVVKESTTRRKTFLRERIIEATEPH